MKFATMLVIEVDDDTTVDDVLEMVRAMKVAGLRHPRVREVSAPGSLEGFTKPVVVGDARSSLSSLSSLTLNGVSRSS